MVDEGHNTMNEPAKRFLIALSILISLLAPAWAASTYSTSVSGATSLTISAATSGMTSPDFGVYLIDSNNVKRPTSEYSGVINQSNYSVTITFSPPFTGTVKLKGLFSGADTNHAYDFKLTLSSGVRVCDGCVDTSAGYAKRTVNGVHYVSTTMASADFDFDSPSCNGGGVVAYILDNQLYFGDPYGCMSNVVNAKVSSASSYPAGSVPLGYARRYDQNWQGPYDDRPWAQ